MRIAPVLTALSLIACSGGAVPESDPATEDALTGAIPEKFVLASASDPSCIGSAAVNVPLGSKAACTATPELTYHAASKQIRLAADPNQCLDVQLALKSPGAAVMFHPCHGQSNQTWRVSAASESAPHLAAAARIEAFASESGTNLCLASRQDGKLIIDTCGPAADREWLLDQRVAGGRLVQRGRVVTSLFTFGMLEDQTNANKPVTERGDALAPAASNLAVSLVQRVLPALPAGTAPRVLLVLDDKHHGENAGDAGAITRALNELLVRTEARLAVEVRASVEVSVTKIQAIIEDELSRMTLTLTDRRATIRLLVATALVITTTKSKVELIDEPAGGISLDQMRMKGGERPHVVWFSNPGHRINDAKTVDSLLRFAQRGGGVVVQGDDAAQGTARLTGLDLRDGFAVANGDVYCGQSFDNGAGRYPISSPTLGLNGLVYTDDLDHAKIVEPRAQVLAESRPTCQGRTDTLPAVVLLDRDPPTR